MRLLCLVLVGARSARAAHDLDCKRLVPNPIDSAPIRSPQDVHTALLEYFAGRELVEIGTRNGDGMSCFARVARKAVAVELSKPYCLKLEERAAELKREKGYTFNVICDDYRKAVGSDGLDADFFHWWQQPPHLHNQQVVHSLHALLKRGQIRNTAVGVMIFDPKFPGDHRDLKRYNARAAWVHRIEVDELDLCKRDFCAGGGMAGRTKPNCSSAVGVAQSNRACARARGSYFIMGLPLANATNTSTTMSNLGY